MLKKFFFLFNKKKVTVNLPKLTSKFKFNKRFKRRKRLYVSNKHKFRVNKFKVRWSRIHRARKKIVKPYFDSSRIARNFLKIGKTSMLSAVINLYYQFYLSSRQSVLGSKLRSVKHNYLNFLIFIRNKILVFFVSNFLNTLSNIYNLKFSNVDFATSTGFKKPIKLLKFQFLIRFFRQCTWSRSFKFTVNIQFFFNRFLKYLCKLNRLYPSRSFVNFIKFYIKSKSFFSYNTTLAKFKSKIDGLDNFYFLIERSVGVVSNNAKLFGVLGFLKLALFTGTQFFSEFYKKTGSIRITFLRFFAFKTLTLGSESNISDIINAKLLANDVTNYNYAPVVVKHKKIYNGFFENFFYIFQDDGGSLFNTADVEAVVF